MRKIVAFAVLLAAGPALAACGEDPASSSGQGASIVVKATDTTCEVAQTQSEAGTVTFTIKNEGSKVTEFYVYAAGDRVMGEVEDIAPGISRELRVELSAGAYETACKPGMAGKGIRGTFTVLAR